MYLGRHVKCPIFSARLQSHVEFRHRFFMKVPHIKFHGNPSSASRADTGGQAEAQRRRQQALIANMRKAPVSGPLGGIT